MAIFPTARKEGWKQFLAVPRCRSELEIIAIKNTEKLYSITGIVSLVEMTIPDRKVEQEQTCKINQSCTYLEEIITHNKHNGSID